MHSEGYIIHLERYACSNLNHQKQGLSLCAMSQLCISVPPQNLNPHTLTP